MTGPARRVVTDPHHRPSLRHWFITGLARAGVSPKMAQTLARRGDIRLALGVHTHVELPDRSAAIESLPAPPDAGNGKAAHGHPLRATGADG